MDAEVMELRLQQWKPIFEAQAKSGLGKEEWCKQNGVRRWEFYRRQRELRQFLLGNGHSSDSIPPEKEMTDLTPSTATFVELPMKSENAAQSVAPKAASDGGGMEITCGKFKIKLKGFVEESVLETVIRTVAHA